MRSEQRIPFPRRWAVWLSSLGTVILAVAVICVATGHGSLFGGLALGPLQGWFGAAHRHGFPTALQVLLPSALSTLAAFVYAARRRSLSALLLGTILWFFWGYYFLIGIET